LEAWIINISSHCHLVVLATMSMCS